MKTIKTHRKEGIIIIFIVILTLFTLTNSGYTEWNTISAEATTLQTVHTPVVTLDETIQYDSAGNAYTYYLPTESDTWQVMIQYYNGAIYKGSYSNKKLNGKGTMVYPNGDKYTGTFKNGKRSGKGTYKWKNGAYYSGKWVKDKMKGKGTYYYQSSSKGKYLKGTWKNNKPSGTLQYKTKSGKTFKTKWSGGKCRKVTR